MDREKYIVYWKHYLRFAKRGSRGFAKLDLFVVAQIDSNERSLIDADQLGVGHVVGFN